MGSWLANIRGFCVSSAHHQGRPGSLGECSGHWPTISFSLYRAGAATPPGKTAPSTKVSCVLTWLSEAPTEGCSSADVRRPFLQGQPHTCVTGQSLRTCREGSRRRWGPTLGYAVILLHARGAGVPHTRSRLTQLTCAPLGMEHRNRWQGKRPASRPQRPDFVYSRVQSSQSTETSTDGDFGGPGEGKHAVTSSFVWR